MTRLVFATHNAHKVEEVRALLDGSGLELETLADLGFADDPPETQATFEGNALQKARFVFERTGRPCVADDSGIEVDALDGAPGVHSKRFSPSQQADDNNRLLLEKLDGIEGRTARFRCVIAVVGPDGERTAEGRVEGVIGTAERGTGGFGYDPLFWPDETPGRTMAELSMDDKNKISHRGRAFRQLPGLVGSSRE
ncbi:MAG: RdgB/HAM1 family non-canonical purine NTP pyrophosphatase [Myxococcota bacterium]